MNVRPLIEGEAASTDGLWYKDAIIYQLHVKAFADSNEDGIGDFIGLTQRLDYLQDLGVNTLWLLPFYPSPGRDDGYDIADYRRINPDFGNLRDFRRFMVEAKRRGLRVITELVMNHTSDQHPWFKRARRSKPKSNARDWYVWSDTDHRYAGTRIIFTDTERSNWAWDPVAEAYYWHRFYSHQPDLNYENPRVLWAMVQVMRRWLDLGVDGFRLDAIPYLCEREGTSNENLPQTHAVIKQLRAELDAYAPGTVFLAEANQWPEDVSAYFGQGDECHMAYHFPLMPRIYMAIAQEDRHPITDILRQTPDIPTNCQWALFLRNHDELTLEMVTDVERDYLWSTYAANPRTRINLGIRRRLAPLMDNDRRKIELMNSLLMSFPGTPIIYYGDEIGMGDNVYLGDRDGVRTPMQWTSDRNGGFSRCDPSKLYLPMISDPVYGYQAVNVEAQSRSLSSLLSMMKRIIAVRRSTPVFGRGSLTFLRPSNRAVLAYLREYGDEVVLCVANLSRSAQGVELDLTPWKGLVPLEMLSRNRFPPIGEGPFVVTLAPYGFFWFRLCQEVSVGDKPVFAPEYATLVLRDHISALLEGRSRQILEREVLPPFLTGRRWFVQESNRPPDAEIVTAMPVDSTDGDYLWTIAKTGNGDRYAMMLGVDWTVTERDPRSSMIMTKVRRGSREGRLVENCGAPGVIRWLLDRLRGREERGDETARFVFRPTAAVSRVDAALTEARIIDAEQSNTSVIGDAAVVVKFLRRLQAGINPEIEMGHHLTEMAGYANTPPLLGWVALVEGDQSTALATVHGFIENQGDAWAFSASYLDRYLDEQKVIGTSALSDSPEHISYLQHLHQIGRRTAELHRALAGPTEDPAFAPEPVTEEDAETWFAEAKATAQRNLALLERMRSNLSPRAQVLAEQLLARRDELAGTMVALAPRHLAVAKIRHHGDLHLGQILIVKDDVHIIDFEGEPHRSMPERRTKMPAARDVAGMVRSFDYAATAALERNPASAPEESERLDTALNAWRRIANESFLAGYIEAADAGFWPEDAAEAQRLVDFFVLDKAIYELGYELSNRPSWTHVPLIGILRLLPQPEPVPSEQDATEETEP